MINMIRAYRQGVPLAPARNAAPRHATALVCIDENLPDPYEGAIFKTVSHRVMYLFPHKIYFT